MLWFSRPRSYNYIGGAAAINLFAHARHSCLEVYIITEFLFDVDLRAVIILENIDGIFKRFKIHANSIKTRCASS